ncbi:MAG: hypothetical protein ACR2IB_00635 [Pyrinomonadaceae bacterium]
MKRAYQLSVALFVGLVVAHAAPGQVPTETEPDEVVRIDANLVTIPARRVAQIGSSFLELDTIYSV